MNAPLHYIDPTGYDWWDDAKKAAESFLQGFSDQYVYAWSGYEREGFGDDPSAAYQWGRFAGQQWSNLQASYLMSVGQGMMDISGRAACPVLPLIPGTGIGKPHAIIVGGQVVYVAGAFLAAQGAAVLGRNALNPVSFFSSSGGGGGQRNLPFDDPDRVSEINKTLDRVENGSPYKYPQYGIEFRNDPDKTTDVSPLPAKPQAITKNSLLMRPVPPTVEKGVLL